MKNYQEMLKAFFDAQMETTKVWQEIFEKSFENAADGQTMQSFFNPEEYFKAAYDVNQKYYTAYTGEPGQLYAKMQEGQKAYQNAYKAWLKLNDESFKPSAEAAEKMYQEWKDGFAEQMQSSYLSYLPDAVRSMVDESVSLMDVYRQAAEKYWEPWMGNRDEFYENFTAGLTADPTAYLDFLQGWKDNYEKSISKMVNIPTMGFHRELMAQQSENFDKFIRFSTLVSEVMANIYQIGQNTMRKVFEDYMELYKEGKQFTTFEEFYNFWAKEISSALDALYFSSEFSQLVGETLKAMTELKQESDKLWEEYLEYLPIPKNSDMDSLYKTVYQLKREVRELKKELKELKKPAAAAPVVAEKK